MIERLLITVLLFGGGLSLYLLFTRLQVQRLAGLDHSTDPILKRVQQGKPAIVYFTTPQCIPCKTQQQPAISKVREMLGNDEIQVIQIDATAEPDTADHWGVLSAPTTFVLDRNGKTKRVNHGVADASKLIKQLQTIA